jgi:hypothetical protein
MSTCVSGDKDADWDAGGIRLQLGTLLGALLLRVHDTWIQVSFLRTSPHQQSLHRFYFLCTRHQPNRPPIEIKVSLRFLMMSLKQRVQAAPCWIRPRLPTDERDDMDKQRDIDDIHNRCGGDECKTNVSEFSHLII